MTREKPSCLVFAAKAVGLECLRFLIDEGKDCISRLFVGSAGDEALLDLARGAGLEADVASPSALENLAASGPHFDWLLNFWCPHILKADILALAERRLNVHPGLVPHCRGNDAAAWALRRGLPVGVSLIEMSPRIDAGGVYAQKRLTVAPGTRGRSLHEALQHACVALFREEWPRLRHSSHSPAPQGEGGSYFTRGMTEVDRRRPGSDQMTLDEVVNWALAHDFSPGTTAEVTTSDGRRYRIRIEDMSDEPHSAARLQALGDE